MDDVLDTLPAGASLVAAAGVLFVACDVRRPNARFDRLSGRVEAQETGTLPTLARLVLHENPLTPPSSFRPTPA